jgi:serine phosphatase RsbU (regulator of sigma subunit)
MSKIFLYSLIAIFCSSLTHSQTTTKDKILFPEYYSYHYGDDAKWSKREFNDHLWDKVAIDSFPSEEWNGIGWFRMWVEVDSSLIGKPLGFSTKLIGAIDVFIDGRYRFSFGMVGTDMDEEEPLYASSYLPPQVFVFRSTDSSPNRKSKHLIAFRYSSFLLESPISIGIEPSFSIKIDNFEQLRLEQREIRTSAKTSQMLFIGIFLSFSLIHMLLYIFYPSLKANLHFSILTAVASIMIYLRFDTFFIFAPGQYVVNFILSHIIVILFLLAMLKISYYVIDENKPRLLLSFIIIGAILSLIFIFRPFRMWPAMIIFLIIILGEILRTLAIYFFKPKELHMKGSWIILVGIVPIGITGLFQLLASLNVVNQIWDTVDIPITYYALIGFAISMSIFLSKTFAWTNKDLEKQLEQVKLLSEKTLKQEIEKAHLAAENKRKSEELEQARKLQLSMLPEKVPELQNVDIAVFMKTATEVGGDYYDFKLDSDDTLTIAFGDATGHGMQAGSVVTATKSLFKSYANLKDPVQIQKEISGPLRLMGFNRLVMAMIIAKIKKYKLQVSVAGMPFPLIYRADSDEVEEIAIPGMPLGSFNDFPYKSEKLDLRKGDTLLFMSDGFQEMFNEKGEILGDERVIEGFKVSAQSSPEKIIAELIIIAENWAGTHPQEDDMTLMVIKFR